MLGGCIRECLHSAAAHSCRGDCPYLQVHVRNARIVLKPKLDTTNDAFQRSTGGFAACWGLSLPTTWSIVAGRSRLAPSSCPRTCSARPRVAVCPWTSSLSLLHTKGTNKKALQDMSKQVKAAVEIQVVVFPSTRPCEPGGNRPSEGRAKKGRGQVLPGAYSSVGLKSPWPPKSPRYRRYLFRPSEPVHIYSGQASRGTEEMSLQVGPCKLESRQRTAQKSRRRPSALRWWGRPRARPGSNQLNESWVLATLQNSQEGEKLWTYSAERNSGCFPLLEKDVALDRLDSSLRGGWFHARRWRFLSGCCERRSRRSEQADASSFGAAQPWQDDGRRPFKYPSPREAGG